MDIVVGEWVHADSLDVPVVILRDVTHYESHLLVLRWDLEIMMPDGSVVVMRSIPAPGVILTPLNTHGN